MINGAAPLAAHTNTLLLIWFLRYLLFWAQFFWGGMLGSDWGAPRRGMTMSCEGLLVPLMSGNASDL